MIKGITIGQYVPSDSFVHKLDPRVKIVLSILYMVCLFMVNDFRGYTIIIPFTFFLIFLSKLKLKYVYSGLKPIFVLLIITGLINIFMYPGEKIIFQWKFITIYMEALTMAIFMVLRLVFLIVGTSILTLTTTPIELTDGMEKLFTPLKKIGFPAHEMSMMITIALRFIPTLIDETDKIMKAQKARGADFETGNIFARGKSLIPILIPLFISSFKRADELAMAMEARCYRGGEGRTRMKQLKLKGNDFMAVVVFIIFMAISISSKWWFLV